MINSVDFFARYNQSHRPRACVPGVLSRICQIFRVEMGFLVLNSLSVLPFLANWWLAPIQRLVNTRCCAWIKTG